MNILIRADASSKIGTGHLMRCLALAQKCQKKEWQVIFYINDTASVFADRLIGQSIEVVYLRSLSGSVQDAQETSNLAKELNCQWVVVDGYNFGADYQKIIKDRGLNLLSIDDYGHANHYYADLVLNQNITANEKFYYNREPYTQLLLGTDYALLRREFWQWQGWKRINPPIAKKILVTMGGADPDNVTLKVITALQNLEDNELETVVIVGGSNLYYEQLKLASQKSQFPIRLEKNVTNMPELVAWADLAVSAGGSTCWELAFMGLPSLILILAENQRAIAQKLNELGIAINLGYYQDVNITEISSAIDQLIISANLRAEMTKFSQKLVDAKGSQRVLTYIEKDLLKVRSVCKEDCKLLWEWANDPEVRAASFASDPIAWEDHVQWFNSKLTSENCVFYIVTNYQNLSIGQVRYDIENNQAIISISIDHNFRYQGYGSHLLKIAQERLFQEQDITRIHAYIKPSNQSSIKTFTKAGFQSMDITTQKGHPAVHLILDR
ncbi:UDP-2,4-diacetamido-2,4,6-trideoxy-beta-L-altropyranose hydrolase [Anabaena cylindrica UHCC 0172]|uniref:UDP-2,4-diacetamido-2,4, 6-trideoxy-beta-L-altropyranose hydrolase n=1 Tax=Anabaena cylindrica TaxID=1165 RepID=UPI002B21A316|nr:UDP-2,4-diacetamido-2,4,6-trideoxy-beta-L-altropyranose hydrolase [Anabaena cylindrica]MEA5549893.1 UDP-2,4-diacetamido-2,4,6-trideoxy-beta-L-altropyranose hydrolase [Anabaena cylindrica UHCC 0172]